MLFCYDSLETKSTRHPKSPIETVIVCVLVRSAYIQYVPLAFSPSCVRLSQTC